MKECGRMTARMGFWGKCGRTDEVCGRTYRLKGQNLKETYSVRPHRGRTKAAQSSESRFMGGLSIFGWPVHVPGLKIDHGIMGDVHRSVNWQIPRPYKPRGLISKGISVTIQLILPQTHSRQFLRRKKRNFDTNTAQARDHHRRLVYSFSLIFFWFKLCFVLNSCWMFASPWEANFLSRGLGCNMNLLI